jgi:hypothetical protein
VDLSKPNQNITFKVGATNFELQRAIEAALPAAVAQTKDLANKFKGTTEKESCQKIFSFLKNDITYKVDGDNQKIKLPSAFLREKSGDCKSYSLFTGAILANLKIPFNFTYASYNPKDKTPEHIYVTTKKGCIIDAVYGKFNAEKKPSYKYQKSMNISYISGIKEMRTEKSYKRKNNYSNIGNIFSQTNPSLSGFQGLGRTGIDWGNAVGRSFSAGEKWEYYSKNISLAPARAILTNFISNNGGGIANFLYSMWLRDVPYSLPNEQKYQTELKAGLDAINLKYAGKLFAFTTSENAAISQALYSILNYDSVISKMSEGTAKTAAAYEKAQKQVLTSARYNEFLAKRDLANAHSKEQNSLRDGLNKKYPYNTRFLPLANGKSKEKYRGIEWKWFWSLGGSPDDLNNAVKEGNGKSPRGKDANYMLNKAFNGGLSIKDLPLVIKAFVSAEAGDKFGLGDEGTYLLAINGTNRIGGLSAATITTYSAVIIPIVSFIGDEIRKYLAAEKAAEAGGSNNPNPNFPPPANDDLGSSNTTMLLIGAAAVGAYLILDKK